MGFSGSSYFQPEARHPGEEMQGPRWVRSEVEQDEAREGKESRWGDAQEADPCPETGSGKRSRFGKMLRPKRDPVGVGGLKG